MIRTTYVIAPLEENVIVNYTATLDSDCVLIQPTSNSSIIVELPDNPKVGQCVSISHQKTSKPWSLTIAPSTGAMLSTQSKVGDSFMESNPQNNSAWVYAEAQTEIQVVGTLNSLGDKFYSKDLLSDLQVKAGDQLLFDNGGLLRPILDFVNGIVHIEPTWAPSGGPLYTARVRYTQGIWWRVFSEEA